MASQCADLERRLAEARRTYPDGRTREHKSAVKGAYQDTISDLVQRVLNRDATIKNLRSRMTLNTTNDDPEPTCSICMENMCGRVTLVCGHELCPECFAQHARQNNTCPFCRETFAPKVKKPTKMPLEQLNNIAETYFDALEGTGDYFTEQQGIQKSECISYATILMEFMKEWYDKDIDD
tara:strand:- start:1234 stop:1773 length:540 start_codon:yes stop_codon:yes gene_type:complete